MQGGEQAYPGGSAADQIPGQPAADCPGVVRLGKAGLGRKCVALKPFQQGKVRPQTHHGILRRVGVQITQGLQDQLISVIDPPERGKPRGQGGKDAGDPPVLHHEKAVLRNLQRPKGRSFYNIALQNKGIHSLPP